MEKLHEQLPNRTDIATAQMPVGCGIQLMVKLEGTGADAPTRAWTADDVLAEFLAGAVSSLMAEQLAARQMAQVGESMGEECKQM